LTDPEWKTLGDVVEILSVSMDEVCTLYFMANSTPALEYPHDIQQLMSGETTPSLTGILPTFHGPQNQWEVLLSTTAPTQKCYILAAMEWLNKYHEKARKTPTYVMAMGACLISAIGTSSMPSNLFPSLEPFYKNFFYHEILVPG
jgi:hypothetical protein